MAKAVTDRIAALKAQQEKTSARIAALQNKARGEQRKRETRRKIVVGGAILVAMEKDEHLARLIRLLLARQVGRAIDRDVIADLLTPLPAPPAAPFFAPAARSMASTAPTAQAGPLGGSGKDFDTRRLG